MKNAILLFCFCILAQQAMSQNPVDLRGVRYYYSTPSLGDITNSLAGFKPLTIDEKNDHYYLSGKAFWNNYLVKINKYTNTPIWDFRDSSDSHTAGLSFTLEENIITATSISCTSGCNDDSLRTTVFSSNGDFEIKKFPADTFIYLRSFNRVKPDINMASGSLDLSAYIGVTTFPYGLPCVVEINDDGQIIDKKILPITNTYQNLAVSSGRGIKTFTFKNEYVSFGYFNRQYSINQPNYYTPCPVIWHWNSDTVYTTREILTNYANHNSEISDEDLIDCDGYQDAFTFAFYKTTDGTNPDPFPAYVAYIDSSLNVIWDKKVGNQPPQFGYSNIQVRISPISGEVLIVGQCINMDTYATNQFVAKYSKNGTLIYMKYFTIDESSDNTIFAFNILDDDDLIFAGRSYKDGITSFFTYRTGSDGYHEDGQYLGLEVVTSSPTEIGIFPNPSDGIFQVSSISTEPMKITMLDQQGKQVAQFELDELSSNNSFDLSDQAPGVYFAHVSQGEQQWVKKLVVR
jgi:hypothetical protein